MLQIGITGLEAPVLIEWILKHLKERTVSTDTARLPPGRAPPQTELFEHF